MRIPFTKMQGAGNDFVVLDETRRPLGLGPAHYRFLGDRHFGVGADQILSVRPSPRSGIDFAYAIHNADGDEVEHCGNGARCFLKFVRDRRMTDRDTVTVQTRNRVLELRAQPDGRVHAGHEDQVLEVVRLIDRAGNDSRDFLRERNRGIGQRHDGFKIPGAVKRTLDTQLFNIGTIGIGPTRNDAVASFIQQCKFW